MNSKKDDKTFKAVILTALIVVLVSAGICAFMLFMPDRKAEPTVLQTQSKGEFIGYIVPDADKYCSSGETLELSVSAENGAQAYAMISGQKIPLSVSAQSTDGYCVLSGSYQLPTAQSYAQELGNVAFFVTYEGITQICYGGKITVNALASQETQQTTQPEVSVSQSGELGTAATALTVTGMIAEGKQASSDTLTFDPTYGNLIRGMTDYVTTKIIDTDDDGNTVNFYKLMSGRAVKEDENITLTSVSSQMNYNTASLSAEFEDGIKKIKIMQAAKAPYRLRYVGQAFNKGYESLKYNVSPFCAVAVDFIFDYTVAFTGNLSDYSDDVISGITVSINPDDKTMILHCVLKNPGKFYGYNMEYDAQGALCISFRQPVRRISDLVIIIDAGHGGTSSGAVDTKGKYREADQTLAISKYLASYLVSAGATVYMTRTSDTDVSLEARRLMAQQIRPDLFISIHLNAGKNTSRYGTSAFYFTPFSQPIAAAVNNRLISVYKESCYKYDSERQKNVNDGVHYYPFFVTRTDVCPSTLVEVGYITNELESKYLVDGAYQQAFGKAIYDGINDYVFSMS